LLAGAAVALLSPLGIGNAVASGLAFSTSDYFRKVAAATCPVALVLFVIVAIQMPVLAAWAFADGDMTIRPGYWPWGLADGAAGLAANLLYLQALRRSPLSLVVPLLGLVPAVTLLFAAAMLGELPTAAQGAGVALVAAGLLAIYSPPGFSLSGALRALVREPGTLPMTGVVLLWSLTPSLDKICLTRASVGIHGLIQLAFIEIALAGWLVSRGISLRAARTAARPLVASGIAAGFAYGFQLAAYGQLMVAFVELAKRVIGAAGSLAFGRLFLREPLTGEKLVGIAVLCTGITLIMFA
jgi:uncharacterized membrane protein